MSDIQKVTIDNISPEDNFVLARPIILGTGVTGLNAGIKITDKIIATLKRLGFTEVWISSDENFDINDVPDDDPLTQTQKFNAIKEDISNTLADIMTERDPVKELLRIKQVGIKGDMKKMMESGILTKLDPARPALETRIIKQFSNSILNTEKLNKFLSTCVSLLDGPFSPRNIDKLQLNLSDNRSEESYIFHHSANCGLYFLATIARYNADLKARGAVSSELKYSAAFDHERRKKTMFFFSDDEVISGALGSFMHDIGYLHSGMPEILAKHGAVTEKEHAVLQHHVHVSMNILQHHTFFDTRTLALNAIENHHERLDGSGYPKGRTNFHVFSRILSIIDCFDSMTTDRLWRKKFARSKVLQWLYDNSGDSATTSGEISSAMFDREMVRAFEKILLLYDIDEVVDIYHEKTQAPVFKCVVREQNFGRPDRPIVELLHCYADPSKDVAGKVVSLLNTKELYLGENTEFRKEPIK